MYLKKNPGNIFFELSWMLGVTMDWINLYVLISFEHKFVPQDQDQKKMRSAVTTVNQQLLSRNRRNRRNRIRANRDPIVFVVKTTYVNSSRTADGVLILSKRKRALPTAEEVEDKKKKKVDIQTKQVSLTALRHTVVNLYEHDAFFDNC